MTPAGKGGMEKQGTKGGVGPGMTGCACHPRTQEMEAEILMSQSELSSKSEARIGYRVSPASEKTKVKTKTITCESEVYCTARDNGNRREKKE